MASDTYQTYRLRGIPERFEKRDVCDLIRNALGLASDARLKVHSLAANPYHQGKVATVTFHDTPMVLTRAAGFNREKQFTVAVEDGGEDEDDDDIAAISLLFDDHFHGFTPVYNEGDEPPQVDILAISGLNGHAFGSFKERKGSFMWLRDLLANDERSARILVYGYDTSLKSSLSFQSLADLGKSFHLGLRTVGVAGRPIIIIGHSLGGLVIREALISMKHSEIPGDRQILEHIRGVLAFGVPSQGMSISSLVAIVGDQPNRALLETLGTNSPLLQRQHRELSDMARDAVSPPFVSFFETKESPTACLAGGKWKMEGAPAVLVEVASATSGCCENYPVNRNHSDIVKLGQWDEELYSNILQTIRHLQQGQLLSGGGHAARTQHLIESTAQYNGACLQSLSFPEQELRHHEIACAENTCQWLLEDHRYQSWLQSRNGLLWIQGKPGAGKSTTMRYTVDKFGQPTDSALVLSFFINGRGTTLQKTPLGVYRGLLHSLLQRNVQMLPKLTRKFVERNHSMGAHGLKWKWTESELAGYLAKSISETSKTQPIVLFVDALDELGRNPAIEIVAYFEDIITRLDPDLCSVRICFSCRHYPIICFEYGATIHVEDKNTRDIRAVVTDRLERANILSRNTVETIKQEIVTRADGVFQWAILVVERVIELAMRGANAKRIQKHIRKIPSELQALYEELLGEVESKLSSLKLFRWILFSERPLSLEELRHALAIDDSVHYTSLEEIEAEDLWAESIEQLERVIKDLSKGLVESKPGSSQDSEHAESGDDRGSWTVQFIHQSVSDYLLASGLAALNPNTAGSQVGWGHFQLSRICIRNLALQELSLNPAALTMLGYSASWLGHHLRAAEAEGIDQADVPALLLSLSDVVPSSTEFLKHWKYPWKSLVNFVVGCGLVSALDGAISMGKTGWRLERLGDNAGHPNESPLMIVLDKETLTGKARWRLETLDGGGGNPNESPLMIALGARPFWNESGMQRGNTESWILPVTRKEHSAHRRLLDRTVQRLLEQGHDPNPKEPCSLTPLARAADNVSYTDVKMLIEAGAKVQYHPAVTTTPLHVAIQMQDLALFRQILRTQEDANWACPLCTAVAAWCKLESATLSTMIDELLDAGADPNGVDTFISASSIQLAARAGKESLLRLLIERSDMDSCRWDVMLLEAVKECHEHIVQFILAQRPGNVDYSQLSMAWNKRAWSILDILLNVGHANPNTKDEYGQPLLSSITLFGEEEPVRLFLATGRVAPDLQDDHGRTVLSFAVRQGSGKIISMLLNSGFFSADPGKDRWGRTPLMKAVECRSEVIVKLLSSRDEMSMASLKEAYNVVEELYDKRIERPKCQVIIGHLMRAIQRRREQKSEEVRCGPMPAKRRKM